MAVTMNPIDAYLTRLRDLAGQAGEIERFYLFMTDETLRDMEDELADSDQRSEFHDRLLEQYAAWKDALGPERWAEVEAHNDRLDGANRNWLLDEL